MRIAFAALLLVAACKTAAPMLPENPGWIGGQRVAVTGPQNVGVGGPELAAKYLRDDVENDLRSEGFSIGEGGLQVVIESFEKSLLRASVQSDGREVQRIDVNGDELGCVSSMWGLAASDNAHCYSIGLVSAMVQSKAVARAAGARARETPQRTAAVPEPVERQPEPPSSSRVLTLRGKLAVLDLKNFTKDLTRENAQYFTDVIRQASLRMEPALDIMTRENLLVLLQSTGKKLEECEGECEVDTGRRIGADQIVSGEIQKVGTRYKLTLRLHDTHEGKLLSSAIGSGKSIDELDESAQKAAEELFTVR
ncbi:MAG: hypothetical protein ABR567_12380 [Myxococcales bacterium]|nr:DUF3280 domain-containing protein [Myxococcales bacterium]